MPSPVPQRSPNRAGDEELDQIIEEEQLLHGISISTHMTSVNIPVYQNGRWELKKKK
jgi:hypothetical protein